MFDFQKAINGEYVYLNGERISPLFDTLNQTFIMIDTVWDKYGNYSFGSKKYNLSTDPPKKKVIVTAYVYKDEQGIVYTTNHKDPRTCLGEISGEVEI